MPGAGRDGSEEPEVEGNEGDEDEEDGELEGDELGAGDGVLGFEALLPEPVLVDVLGLGELGGELGADGAPPDGV